MCCTLFKLRHRYIVFSNTKYQSNKKTRESTILITTIFACAMCCNQDVQKQEVCAGHNLLSQMIQHLLAA